MPIYNAYEYLRAAIESVLSQTLTEIEVICIDDGSTDKSYHLIKEYQQSDARIRIVTENNAGPSTARNKGIVRARGEYVIFLDADDFYEPTLLQSLYERAERDGLDIAVVRFDLYNDEQAKFTPAINEQYDSIFADGAVASKNEFPNCILQSTTGYAWNKLFKTEFIREKDLVFDPDLSVFEDVHFVATALSLAERVGRVDELLIHHRVYSDQSRAIRFRKYYAQVPVVYHKIKEFLLHHGMYVPLTHSFLNLSAGRCYYIYNLLWSDAKKNFWDMLHNDYADILGWFDAAGEEFENPDVREFVANVGLFTHERYQKRLADGKTLNLERLTADTLSKKIKRVKAGERRRAEWARIVAKLSGSRRTKATQEEKK